LCMNNKLPIIVFNLFKKGNLKKIVFGKGTRTIIADKNSKLYQLH